MSKKLLFDHIYKAGGTSIERALREWVGEDKMTTGLVAPLGEALARYSDKTLITGHFSFLPGDIQNFERYALTMLRHPVDRIISHYHFAAADVGTRGGDITVEMAKSLPFEEYIFSDIPEIRNQLENFQVRHYFPIVWDGSIAPSPADQLNLAKKALQQYDLVGVFGEFADFLNILAVDFGWQPLGDIPHVNATSGRPPLGAINANIVAYLTELNRHDIALYEFGKELFQRRRSALLKRCAFALPNSCDRAEAKFVDETPVERSSAFFKGGKPQSNFGSRAVEFLDANVIGELSRESTVLTGEIIRLHLNFNARQPIDKLIIGISISDEDGRKIFGTNSKALGKVIHIEEGGTYYFDLRFRCDLGYGLYRVTAAAHPMDDLSGELYHWHDQITCFRVAGNIGYFSEGLIKLYPTIECGAAVSSADHGMTIMDISEHWPRLQRIAVRAEPLTEFDASIELLKDISSMRPGEVLSAEVEICNLSACSWSSTGMRAVNVSYHWLDKHSNEVIFDGKRTPLPSDVRSGETARVWAAIEAPMIPGDYVLALTLVQEYVAWFDQVAGVVRTIRIHVN